MYRPIIIKVEDNTQPKRSFRSLDTDPVPRQQALSMYEECFGRKPTDEQWQEAMYAREVR